jgi:hypothetical protein
MALGSGMFSVLGEHFPSQVTLNVETIDGKRYTVISDQEGISRLQERMIVMGWRCRPFTQKDKVGQEVTFRGNLLRVENYPNKDRPEPPLELLVTLFNINTEAGAKCF